MDAVALLEKAKAEAKAEAVAHDPKHAPKDELALKHKKDSSSHIPCDEIELKRKHDHDLKRKHEDSLLNHKDSVLIAKKRPRGLKKKAQEPIEDVQLEEGYERIEMPAEVSMASEGDEKVQLESDTAHDAYALYASAMVEVEKDNTPTAKKFFEGAIHGLQALLEAKEKSSDQPENLHIYTLGMAWCELGVLIDDTEYISRGLQYLCDVIDSGTADCHAYMDAGQMTLSRYSLIHKRKLDALAEAEQTTEDTDDDEANDRVDVSDEEMADVKQALEYLRKGVELQQSGASDNTTMGSASTEDNTATDSDDNTQSLAELAAKYVVNYSQALDGDWRRSVLSTAMDFFRASQLVNANGEWQFKSMSAEECVNMLGFFLDYAECCAAASDFKAAVEALVSGAECVSCAEAEDSGDDKPAQANILKQISEMHVIAGNVYAEAEDAEYKGELPALRDLSSTDKAASASDQQYQEAYAVIQRARELDTETVPDDLFESIRKLVEDADSDDADEN